MKTTKLIKQRYVVALILIAAVLLLSHTLMYRQISQNEKDGYIINISGMQRMLSQRIALLSIEVARAEDVGKSSEMAAKLRVAYDKMKSNQAELNANSEISISSQLDQMYFGDGGLDQGVTEYLQLTEKVLNAFDSDPTDKELQLKTSREVALIARNGFLDQLDSVVFQYQREYEERIDSFQRKELIFLFLGLMILVLEALFIFRPMASRVESTLESLENSNAELREFTYRISHDLRAPVASSLGMISLVNESLAEGDVKSASDGMNRIKGAMERLDELIAVIISITKNRHVEFEHETIDLSKMVAEVVRSCADLPNYDRIKFVQTGTPKLMIRSKTVLLQQSLANLISNSIKYADLTEDRPCVSIEASLKESQCMIVVSDNGIGIPEGSQKEIFGMFKRFHPRQSFGSGLGLYLAKQNIVKLGGSIQYKPLTKGSAFHIQLPNGSSD